MKRRNYIKHYGIIGIYRLILSKLYTIFVIPSARLIRLPVDIRFFNNIDWGKGLTTGFRCRIEAYNYGKDAKGKVLFFGNNVEIGDSVHIAAGEHVSIGNNVLMASKIFITDMLHGTYVGSECDNPKTIPNKRKISIKHVHVGDNVWIGESVSIMPGVNIGNGAIIGANSVVTKNIPSDVIAVGIPAKPIKRFNNKLQTWEVI